MESPTNRTRTGPLVDVCDVFEVFGVFDRAVVAGIVADGCTVDDGMGVDSTAVDELVDDAIDGEIDGEIDGAVARDVAASAAMSPGAARQ